VECPPVKPPPFVYHRPETRDEVDDLLAEFRDEAKILAGGQSLIPVLNMRLAAPQHLIDINHLRDEPAEPKLADGHLTFGPLVRHLAAERSMTVRDHVPLLFETMPFVAHPAIRTRGTVVGSIAHADPAAELPAVLSVLGGSVAIRGAEAARIVGAEDFFVGPLENCLAAGEWVEDVRWPARQERVGFAFEEFARRRGDYALCGVAATARRSGGRLEVALSYLGMGDVPQRLGAECDEGDIDEVVDQLVSDHLDPTGDLHARPTYRGHLARRLGVRAILRARDAIDKAA
jgi:aerobic carbon-monoxide dehydrogenase medium subunit